jgi:hypothetical protein
MQEASTAPSTFEVPEPDLTPRETVARAAAMRPELLERPINDWQLARSYSQPCHGQASSVASASSWKSPGPLDRAHGAIRPWH